MDPDSEVGSVANGEIDVIAKWLATVRGPDSKDGPMRMWCWPGILNRISGAGIFPRLFTLRPRLCLMMCLRPVERANCPVIR